jgi:hypothetical protein
MGGVLYMFSGFFWLEIIHLPVLAAFAWIPWWMASLEKLLRAPTPRSAFLSGLAFAVIFLCGSFQVTLGAFYGGLLYVVIRTFQKDTPFLKSMFPSGRGWLLIVFFLLWGSGPLLIQLIPTSEFAGLCSRVNNPTDFQYLLDYSMPPSALAQFLYPQGTLPPGERLDHLLQNTKDYFGVYGSLGIWTPFLIFAAGVSRHRKVLLAPAVFCLLSLVAAFGIHVPFYSVLVNLLPGFSWIRVPFRFIYLFVLGACFLAAWGFHFLEQESQKQKVSQVWLGAAAIYSLLLGCGARALSGSTGLEQVSLAAGLFSLFIVFRVPSFRKYGWIFFQACLILPLFLSGWSYFQPGPSSNYNFKEILASLKLPPPERILVDSSQTYYPIEMEGKNYLTHFPENSLADLKIRNFGGYNPLTLNSVDDLRKLPIPTQMRLFSIPFFTTGLDRGPISGFQTEKLGSFYLYEYENPLPYVFAPPKIHVMENSVDRLKTLQNPAFDPYGLALFSTTPSAGLGQPEGAENPKYALLRDDPDHQKFGLQSPQSGWVVFSEIAYPGWKAFVDGRPSEILTADQALRAVWIPSGYHEVEFRYQPWWGPWILGGILFWLVLTLFFFWKKYLHA